MAAWISFPEVMTGAQADELVDDLPASGVLLAYRLKGGTTAKVTYRPGEGQTIESLEQQALDRTEFETDGPHAPSDPDVAKRRAPTVAGAIVSGNASQLAELFIRNQCLLYSAELGSDLQYPVLSPAIGS